MSQPMSQSIHQSRARPRLLIFDVNETLSDLSPLGARFAELGLSPRVATVWFTALLRDGFALTSAGTSAPFAEIAAESLRVLFTTEKPDRELEDAVAHVMGSFSQLGVHPDVIEGLDALRELDLRLVTLSNGASSVADALLNAAGVRQHFERLMSVEDAGVWKPAPRSYAYALEECHIDPLEAMLVAVHAWDTHGAGHAGLTSAWINRHSARYPSYFLPPTVQARSLTDLAEQLH